MERELIIQQIKKQGLLPLFYHHDAGICLSVIRALHEAGVRCIEFTNRGEHSLPNFKKMIQCRNAEMKDLLLAVGTIKTAEHARQFIDAGADFLISPFFDAAVHDEAYMQKVFWIPGCATPTEIHVAEQAGCSMIKLFPGNTLGASFVEAVKPLFPGIDFIVTGGVDITEENIRTWFKAGVCGVGIGSKLISKEIVDNNDVEKLKQNTKKVLDIISTIK